MVRVAVGGFQHETNTFAPFGADYDDFLKRDGWPPLTRGEALFETLAGVNLPLGGFIEAADEFDLAPLLWCSAEPSSYVRSEAFERIAGELCERLAAALPCDGVYLDLHGAMVTEHHQDAEGELLRRVRQVVGAELPVVISLDLHANLSEAMLEHSSAMAIFRTYPHLDMAAAGARSAALLRRLLRGERLFKALRRVEFLIPLSAQGTDFEPHRSLYRRLDHYRACANVDYAAGFPLADIHDCGPAVVAFGPERGAVEQAADDFQAALGAAEGAFRNDLLSADAAIERALDVAPGKPVVIADVQDNPGAGATSDTMHLVERLVARGVRGALAGVTCDREAAALAHVAGVSGVLETALGGKLGTPDSPPLRARFAVEALSDGRFACTGAMYAGVQADLGPMALLRVLDTDAEVRVVVSSERFQCLDQAVFTHLGVQPAAQRVLVVKSTVHFRADFAPLAAEVLLAAAPGANPCRLHDLDYRRLRPGVRRGVG